MSPVAPSQGASLKAQLNFQGSTLSQVFSREFRLERLRVDYDSRMRRVLLKTLAAVLVPVALAATASCLYLRRSLPEIAGTKTAAGISAPIDIIRDADAIPHVFAANKADALFGLGYVHAQDRLW